MVAPFTWGNKDSTLHHEPPNNTQPPPPPYKETRANPVILAERTTTTTEIITTTTQTTHFFSLPLWRKRGVPTSTTSARQSVFDFGADENGTIHRIRPVQSSASLIMDKALPPTPVNASREELDTPWGLHPQETRDTSDTSQPPHLVSRKSSRTGHAVPTSQSTAALAHAALGLGLGLTHVMPLASASSSSSEINTVAFMSTPLPQDTDAPASGRMRRSKSSQKLGPSSSELVLDSHEDRGYRRTRGLSLGTTSLLNFGSSDAKGKAKEKQTDDTSSPHAPPKLLARRSSFWSRKKTAPPPEKIPDPPLPPRASEHLHVTPLPPVQPLSPFILDVQTSTSTPSAIDFSTAQQRSLSRSFSESPTRISEDVSEHTPPPARRRPQRRPSTADSSVRSRTRSFFNDTPAPLTESPLPSPVQYRRTYHDPEPPSLQPPSSRPRALTNPPILHRLSLSLFSSSSSSSSPSSNPFSNTNGHSPIITSSNSPRPSLNKIPVNIPKPHTDDESPEVYLSRLLTAVSKAEVAAVLASSSDPFHVRALRVYIEQFNFVDDPLDVALRKLLMDVGLPRETQQIDRVIEAFASRYLQCNPTLFTSEDHPYILAFSLIMLHTDAFNRSNKRKMTKADYIKNTRLPGVAPEVLDCFYDNIVFAPFIFVEDPLDVNGQRGLVSDSSSRTISTVGNSPVSATNGSSALLGKGTKLDPYYLIAHNLLGPLRVNIEAFMSLTNPYSYEGTAGPWDEEDLQRAFAKASTIEVGAVDNNRPAPFFGISVGGAASPLVSGLGALPEILPNTGEIWTLKVTKVGLLNRKDDFLEGGKKATYRKWKLWSVILTGSQLLFFRDPSWATTLLAQSETSDGQIIFPQTSIFKPDELLSVKDAIAVFDRSYTKYKNTLRFVMPDGRQFLLQASDEHELNEWISRINYASAFKSAGVRMRALAMSGKDVHLTGVAAATSHLHDMQNLTHTATPKVHSWDGDAAGHLMGMLSGGSEPTSSRPQAKRRITMISGRSDMDLDVPVAPEIEGADQFKATFDQVKAELAAGRWATSDASPKSENISLAESPEHRTTESPTSLSGRSDISRLPSRFQIIQSKVQDLESKISAARTQLDSDLRFVRNIATLTPFQRSTRDRLQVAVQNMAKRIMQVRLDITKLECHRDVLSNDLAAEGRNFNRAKKVALKAATETLQSRFENRIPRMTLSFHDGETEGASPQAIPKKHDASPSRRPESSICESFHSALDFGPDWPSSSEDLNSSSFLNPSPARSSSGSLKSFPFPDVDTAGQQNGEGATPSRDAIDGANNSSDAFSSSRVSQEIAGHDRFYTAQEGPEEQAEDWNKTRCAQRVSLVRLPSDIRLSSLYERHAQMHPGSEPPRNTML